MTEKAGNRQKQSRSTGFTIVELVVVIFVLALISMTAMSRFNDENAFTGLIVRDQIISQARRAQQGAFGRSDISLVFIPNEPGTQATLEVLEASTALSSITLSIDTLSITGDTDVTLSCAAAVGSSVTDSSPFTLRFGELGDLVASSGVAGAASFASAPKKSVRFCVNQDINASVCISPAGFAYAGDCDV